MPALDERRDLTIESVAYRGRGIARLDGWACFVDGVAPGELVRVRVEKLHRNFVEARLLDVLQPSADRIAPCCRLPDGTRVPGCVYDHLAYAAELAVKQRQLDDFLRRLPGAAQVTMAPPCPSPLDRHYRNKLVLHAQRQAREPQPRLGYYGDDNRTVIDIPACPLARAEINTALAAFRQSVEFRRLRQAESVTFRWTATDGVVVWRDDHAPTRRHLTELAPCGAMAVPVDGFYQVNPEVAAALMRQVMAWYAGDASGAAPDAPRPPSASAPNLLDLYCGVGVFALACGKMGAPQVAGIEAHPAALAAAQANAVSQAVAATFHCQAMSAAAQQRFGGLDLTETTVIVDPPRQGLEPVVAQALAAAQPPRIFYISCDPATLTRDLKILLPAGYAIRQARLFDMFPRTAHFETAVWLERGRDRC
jgi:23S rRNA (uracil1939-C5)-methyltransferase